MTCRKVKWRGVITVKLRLGGLVVIVLMTESRLIHFLWPHAAQSTHCLRSVVWEEEYKCVLVSKGCSSKCAKQFFFGQFFIYCILQVCEPAFMYLCVGGWMAARTGRTVEWKTHQDRQIYGCEGWPVGLKMMNEKCNCSNREEKEDETVRESSTLVRPPCCAEKKYK